MHSPEAYQDGYQFGWQLATNQAALPLGPLGTARRETEKRFLQTDTARHVFSRGVQDGIVQGWKSMLKLARKTHRDLSVVMAAKNEEHTIAGILREVQRLNPKEIIVIVNGSTDATVEIAQAFSCRVEVFRESLGHDVGRTIGARLATGRHMLFVDSDMVISAENLLPFVLALEQGKELVLNNIDPFLPPPLAWDSVSVLKAWLNLCLERSDLGTASMTAVPHGVQRRLLKPQVLESLSVPPIAYVQLMSSGVEVCLANSVDVIAANRHRAAHGDKSGPNQVENLILGDHVEAMEWLRQHR